MLKLRFDLRKKLALFAVLLLGLPWMGYQYIKEMEAFLLEGQRQGLLATARAVATALHDRPHLLVTRPRSSGGLIGPAATLLPGEELLEAPLAFGGRERVERRELAEVEAILRGLERTTSQISVISRDLEVLARAGSLDSDRVSAAPGGDMAHAPQPTFWRSMLARALGMGRGASGEYVDIRDGRGSREVFEALMGVSSSGVKTVHDPAALVVAAAHPVWSGDRVLGVVLVEERADSVSSLRNHAAERLVLLTLVSFVSAAILIFGFASRLSARIRKLRDEAESAIDGQGRISALTTASRASDEIGDLSRSFSALLERLTGHHAYLESMASRLSHELRTPVAVVRSSLENLRMESLPASALTYVDRADAGLARLSRILSRMSEASRMEQALASTETERFDLRAVVAECVNGYRSLHAGRSIESVLPRYPVWVRGTPDLAAQMLDKLVENAAGFARPGTPIRIFLALGATTTELSVTNTGPLLPPEIQNRLFDSMVSARSGDPGGEPHLGLGLYVARMIARFHGGNLRAENLPDGSGVCVSAELRLA